MRMVRTLRAELGTEHGTVQRVARQLGYGVESVRSWVRQADIDDGSCARGEHRGGGADQGARAGEPRTEAGQRDSEAGGQFLRGGARPPTQEVVAFIDANRDECRGRAASARSCSSAGVQVAPSSYYAIKTRPPSARASATRSSAGRAAAVGGQLPGLRCPEDLEGGPPCRPRRRP